MAISAGHDPPYKATIKYIGNLPKKLVIPAQAGIQWQCQPVATQNKVNEWWNHGFSNPVQAHRSTKGDKQLYRLAHATRGHSGAGRASGLLWGEGVFAEANTPSCPRGGTRPKTFAAQPHKTKPPESIRRFFISQRRLRLAEGVTRQSDYDNTHRNQRGSRPALQGCWLTLPVWHIDAVSGGRSPSHCPTRLYSARMLLTY